MRTRIRDKVMAGLMTLILTVGIMPADFLGENVVYASETQAASGDSTVITFNATELPEGDITTELIFGDFVLNASEDKKYTVDANDKANEDGSVKFKKRLKSNGKSSETERVISFKTGGAGTATVYMLSSNKDEDNRALSLHNAETGEMLEGASYYAPTAAGDGGAITPVVYDIPGEGSYKFMASQGINIYYIEVEYSGTAVESVKRKDWSQVDEPVINSISINEQGTIDVDVTMEIGTDGADTVRLFLFQNGYESMSVQVPESGVYTLAPSLKGNFTAKVIASRKGYLDKESEEVKIKDYKLPLGIPEINWLNNLGNGQVYVDWRNVESEGFQLEYRVEGSGDYIVAASNLTVDEYTLTNLIEGETYEIKVTATKDGKTSEDVETIEVGDPVQQWYVAAMGSATSGKITVDNKEYLVTTDAGVVPVADITNTDATVKIASATNGKMADSEDGIFYYFTRINPNTENFILTATYTVTDVSDGPDNQTGYGLYATDIAGVGSKDAKYFNSVSVGQFKLNNNGYHGHGARHITGYTASDALNNVGAIRNFDNKNSFTVKNEDDTVNVGDTFTYTLQKTDTEYIASMNGADEEIIFDGTTSLMVQDDGSICVGVASARKVGVEISEITFEKSEGTVSGDSVVVTDAEFNVYSGTTTGSTNYEFIASANVDGYLEVLDASGESVFDGDIEANKVVKAQAILTAGEENTFTYEFYPDENVENLHSYDVQSGTHSVMVKQYSKPGEKIYVSPSGTAEANGTIAAPLDLQTALNYVQPGQSIVLMNGTYKPTKDYVIGRSVCGTADEPIVLIAQTTGGVIFDGSNLEKSNALLTILGSYWHIYGIEIANGPGKGVLVCGNNNTVEMCKFHDMQSAGLQISRYSTEPNDGEMWPSNNLIKNCDAYDCCDEGRTDADGFTAKLTCGEGNKFYGCISHNNIDDGWDLYAKSTTGSIGAVLIENCVAYNNGYLSNEDPTSENTKFGEGNGFKLGGENMFGAHQLLNSVSYNNYGKGITSNSGPNCEVINCTAYNNSLSGKSYNVSLYTKNSNPKAWILTGMLSVVNDSAANPELGAGNGVIYSLRSVNNYIYDGIDSSNNQGVAASIDWFENVDTAVAPTRNADGTINMHGLLVLNSSAPADTGARIDTSKKASSTPPVTVSGLDNVVTNTEPAVEAEVETMSGNDSTLMMAIGAVIAGVVLFVLILIFKRK